MRKDKFKKFKTKPNSKTEAAKKLRTILFSRFIILALLLILQILFFLMFSLKLQSYIEYYLFASVAISSFFLLYFVFLFHFHYTFQMELLFLMCLCHIHCLFLSSSFVSCFSEILFVVGLNALDIGFFFDFWHLKVSALWEFPFF